VEVVVAIATAAFIGVTGNCIYHKATAIAVYAIGTNEKKLFQVYIIGHQKLEFLFTLI